MDVGALFRLFSELPTFTLHASGHGRDCFWRQYQLKASGMTCEINETFPTDVFGNGEDDSAHRPQLTQNDYGGF